MKKLSLVVWLVVFSAPAMAYVGPGLGMGVIGTIFGVLAAIVLAMFGLFWYPLKRAFSKKKASADGSQPAPVIVEKEQTGLSGTTTTTPLDNPSETSSNNPMTNQPGAPNDASDLANAKRTDSQAQ